jgi:heme exporter protein A
VSDPPLLRFDEVACIRGGRRLFEALSLVLGPGEAILVAGPNGSGKTSLIRLAAGLLRPAAGSVAAAGRFALADESAALDERLTLGRALGFWAKLDGARAAPGMAAMGLGELAGLPVRLLSAGQRKRAILARVIAAAAPLWLLDEPANALDADGQRLLAAAMAGHRAAGGAILVASHQPLGLEPDATIELGRP